MTQLPRETLELLIRYMLRAEIDKDAFDRRVSAITHRELQTTTMTLADQLRDEGLQKGLQGGLQEAILEALEIRFGQIPEGLRERVAAGHDLPRLRSLHKAAIKAATLEEFSRSL